MIAEAAPPPPAGTRIATLDVTRGVAVLGILAMNIAGFALPFDAYDNPRVHGGWHGLDLASWAVDFVLFDGKMRGLFSMLFGASMLIVIDSAADRGESGMARHVARMIWLLLFGLAHLWLLWWGDILHHYAIVGMAAAFAARLPVANLLIMAAILLAVQSATNLIDPLVAWLAPPRPDNSASAIVREIALHRSGYLPLLADRWQRFAGTPIRELSTIGTETLAYMLMGMAALRSGLLGGDWPVARYWRWAATCLAIAVPVYAALGMWMWRADFDPAVVALAAHGLTTPVRAVMVTGLACLVVVAVRGGGALVDRLAAAGRMAFSNYIACTLICTTLFYGYGFGLFGRLSRAELVPVVLLLWAAMLLWSKPWLSTFRFGPLEWLWRSLARGKRQPMLQRAV